MADAIRRDVLALDEYAEPEARGGGPNEDARLNAAAEEIGASVGRAVQAVRELPERMDQARSSLKDRLTVIRGSGSEPGEAEQRLHELKDAAQERFEHVRERAMTAMHTAQIRLRRLSNEQPLYVIASVAAFAFVLGASLRVWRSHE
jgi:hypothetical protein